MSRFGEEVLAPLNAVSDVEGCKHTGPQTVTTPTGFKAAYNDFDIILDHFSTHSQAICRPIRAV